MLEALRDEHTLTLLARSSVESTEPTGAAARCAGTSIAAFMRELGAAGHFGGVVSEKPPSLEAGAESRMARRGDGGSCGVPSDVQNWYTATK